MDSFEYASVTLAACRSVLGRLTADDLGRPSPCSQYTVGEVGEHVARSMVLLGSVTGSEIDVAPEVAGYVLGRARLLITPDKRGRSFAAEVPAGPSATALERLIAFTGRER